MAGLRATVNSGEIATTATAKTLLQLVAAANHRVLVKEVSIGFKGTNNTAAPITVDLVRQSTAGTSSSATPVKTDESADETLQTSAVKNCTAEPTGSTIVKTFTVVHPQAGLIWQAPFGGEIPVGGGSRLGLRVSAPADVNAVAEFVFEE